jgi:hypothetical protein
MRLVDGPFLPHRSNDAATDRGMAALQIPDGVLGNAPQQSGVRVSPTVRNAERRYCSQPHASPLDRHATYVVAAFIAGAARQG